MPFPDSILQYPRVNGHALSRTSISIRVDALLVVGWTDFSFKNPRTPGMSYGSRSNKQARTRGKVAPTASITLYELEWNVIRNYLASRGAGRQGWSEVSTTITYTYFEPSLAAASQIVKLDGAQFLDAEQTVGDDDKELVRVCPLDVMQISENGMTSVIENGIPGF